MNMWLVAGFSFVYLALLFGIAFYTERRLRVKNRSLSNPVVYALSLTVYCSAWTYFGSVGRASGFTLDYLTIYLGPTLMMPLFWVIFRKMIRIARVQKLNTLADFISSRYGKNFFLGRVVAIFCTLGILPYIALQIKAISSGIHVLTDSGRTFQGIRGVLYDPAFYMVLALGLFTILFATRKIQTREQNQGLVMAVAFESIVKLVAFLAVGLFVLFFVFEGPADLLNKLDASGQRIRVTDSYADWFAMLVLSGLAIVLLPRQFEMGVVENTNEKHLQKAMWLFPLYLLLINILVFPIAFAGVWFLGGSTAGADDYVLALPLYFGQNALALFTFIGGFSAASSMIIVATVALSKMLSNHLIIPLALNRQWTERYLSDSARLPALARRFSIVFILGASYLYYYTVSGQYALISIGLVSFAAVAQFAPAVLVGLFWKEAGSKGALWGILGGFAMWFYTLVLPSLARSGFIASAWVEHGPLGLEWLKPYALFGMQGLDVITHGFFWSILVNALLFFVVSVYQRRNAQEGNQAEIFVDIFKYSTAIENSVIWRGTAYIPDIRTLLERFLGKPQTDRLLLQFSNKYNIALDAGTEADPRLVTYAENMLSGVIGSSSARLVLGSVVKEENISINEVVNILKESQELVRLNKVLTRTSDQLRKATDDLKNANRRLKEQDELKNEFLYTVTHELRTPLTAIRALSEIIHDNEDLEPEQRQEYMERVVRETERMTRLISQVLDLENFESGKHTLEISEVDLAEIISHCTEAMGELLRQKNIQLSVMVNEPLPVIQADYDKITQVLLNLLSNAVKHVPEQGGRIEVSAGRLGHVIQVDVADNGPGVKEDLASIIFEKFFQARNQSIRKPKGSGLGLAISKKIIQLHEGKIWVEASPAGGALFRFTLPLQTPFSE